jgi:hypothetical protein
MQVILSIPVAALFSKGHYHARTVRVQGDLWLQDPVHGNWGKINNLVVLSISGEK